MLLHNIHAQSNKSDEPPAFFNGQLDVQDIHRVNKHDGDNRAKHLYDNAHGDDQKSVWEHIVASEAARAAPMDGRAMEAARPLRSAEESRRATATQSPMPAVDDFGTPIGSYMVPGGNKKMSNKKVRETVCLGLGFRVLSLCVSGGCGGGVVLLSATFFLYESPSLPVIGSYMVPGGNKKMSNKKVRI
ncbi:hypothetical protein FOA52_012403 [Chlamydomonas sp. UWO 241]|nr:hypothetical protein FOA52_012403 [Chlamydomonas sp. UWO 241]